MEKEIRFWLIGVIVALLSLQVNASYSDDEGQFCPEYSASFVTVIDQLIDSPFFLAPDPECIFFKEVMEFEDDVIQHTLEDAFKFFNDTYGLDFSFSSLNENNEYFFENAKLSFVIFPRPDISHNVIFNNWIKTCSHMTCQKIRTGELLVSFTGDQLLHGSYGGVEGLPADVSTFLVYGFSKIDVCDKSPITIQLKSAIPLRLESIDGMYIIDYDVYSHVFGFGKATGLCTVKPDPENPEKYRFISKVVFTFGN